MLTNRFLLSLVVALFLSTLASANSIDATELLHSGLSANDHVSSSAGYLSTSGGNAASAWFDGYDSRASMGDVRNARVGTGFSGQVIYGQHITDYKMGFAGPVNGMRGARFEIDNWAHTQPKHGLSTPEPGSLMLLSTGLMGIAGMVRRKLRLG